jgi:hypothetical protein
MNLKGKDLEALVLFRASKMEDDEILTLGRYGVQARMMNSLTPPFKPEWQVVPSLPDLEGVVFGTGRQIIIECKVCSQASYPIAGTADKHPKQISHMMRRAEFGALCYLLIHFNARELTKKSDPAMTIAIPVDRDAFMWRMYLANELRTLSREAAKNYGIEVPWNLYSPRASKMTPDLTYLIPNKNHLNLNLK